METWGYFDCTLLNDFREVLLPDGLVETGKILPCTACSHNCGSAEITKIYIPPRIESYGPTEVSVLGETRPVGK